MTRLVVRLAVAAFLAATAGLGASGPATAASCGSAEGVTVVVDFHQLGGGVQTDCDLHGAGRTAATQLVDVGHTVTYVQREPGFVCRIDGTPASDPCVNTPPADAYWSLWWSDGKSGTWSYSSAGVAGLTVPAGGYVALSWQSGSGRATPRATPTAHPTSPPTPTHAPTAHPSAPPAPPTTPTLPTTSTSAPPSPTASTSAGPRSGSTTSGRPVRHHTHPSAGVPTDPTTAGTRADRLPDRATTGPVSGGGLPGWVAPGLVALLFVAAAAVAVVRRKRSGGA